MERSQRLNESEKSEIDISDSVSVLLIDKYDLESSKYRGLRSILPMQSHRNYTISKRNLFKNSSQTELSHYSKNIFGEENGRTVKNKPIEKGMLKKLHKLSGNTL